MAIIVGDDIRDYMGQIPDNATTDALLEDIADRASAVVEVESSPMVFAPYPAAATQQIVFSDGTAFLEVPPYQAGTLTQIRYGASTGQIVAAADYTIQGQLIRLVNYYGYTGFYPNYPYPGPGWGRGPYYVTAKWGYGPAPQQIIQVALEVATNIYQAQQSGGLRQTESVEGNIVVVQTTGLSKRQKDIIAKLKDTYRPVVTV